MPRFITYICNRTYVQPAYARDKSCYCLPISSLPAGPGHFCSMGTNKGEDCTTQNSTSQGPVGCSMQDSEHGQGWRICYCPDLTIFLARVAGYIIYSSYAAGVVFLPPSPLLCICPVSGLMTCVKLLGRATQVTYGAYIFAHPFVPWEKIVFKVLL